MWGIQWHMFFYYLKPAKFWVQLQIYIFNRLYSMHQIFWTRFHSRHTVTFSVEGLTAAQASVCARQRQYSYMGTALNRKHNNTSVIIGSTAVCWMLTFIINFFGVCCCFLHVQNHKFRCLCLIIQQLVHDCFYHFRLFCFVSVAQFLFLLCFLFP